MSTASRLAKLAEGLDSNGVLSADKGGTGATSLAAIVTSSTPAGVSDQANTSTGYFDLPAGTTAQRPVSPNTGMLRYNTTLGTLEQYNSTGWETIGGNQPVIASISGTIYSTFSSNITITGNYFGLNAVIVRFTYGTTVTDVSVTPTSTTSITVTVPSAIYALAAATSGNISVIDAYSKQSNGFIKTILGSPGSSSSYPAASPYAIRQVYGSTPTPGVYWFSNAGYNSGIAFQAYADWSTDSTYGMMVLCGYNISDTSAVSFTNFGTGATSSSGTVGFRNTHYLPSYSILSSWSNNTRNRAYLGMTGQTGGTSIGGSTQKEWLLLNLSLTTLRDMFDNTPGVGVYDDPNGVVNTSTGASGRLYYTTNHGSSIYQMTNAGNTVNSNLWFETREGGSDTNHTPMVWAAGNGSYAAGGSPFSTRWMFIGISPDNV